MKVTLQLSDDAYEQYVHRAGNDPAKVKLALRKVLEDQAALDDRDRAFLVTKQCRQALESILESTIDSAESLTQVCQRLARVGFGETWIEFSLDEIERMQQQAEFMGETIQEYLQRNAADFKLYLMGVA